MVLDKTRKEWRLLLTGDLNVPLKNFFFQMKVTQAKNQIKSGKIDVETAVDEIFDLVTKFQKAKYMSDDLNSIFGKEETIADKDVFEAIEESIKKENEETLTAKEKQKKILLENIKIQEEIARKQFQEKKITDYDALRLEIQKDIERKLNEERRLKNEKEKGKEKVFQAKTNSVERELKEEQEKKQLQKVVKKKRKVSTKKKSFWNRFFGR